MLDSPERIIWALLKYTDWWQPTTTSVIQVGAARRTNGFSDGIRPGLLDTLDEREELCRRMQLLKDKDRHVLFLWYVKQLDAKDIAKTLRISRRQCFRRRSNAVRTLVDLGEPQEAA